MFFPMTIPRVINDTLTKWKERYGMLHFKYEKSGVWPTISLNCYVDYIWYFFNEYLFGRSQINSSHQDVYFSEKQIKRSNATMSLYIKVRKIKKICPQLDQDEYIKHGRYSC